MKTNSIDTKDRDAGISAAFCALYVGIFCLVLGGVVAVLVHYRIEQPFWLGVMLMVLAAVGFGLIAVLWLVLRKFRKAAVLIAAACWTLTFYSLIDTVVVPLVRSKPGVPFPAVLRMALVHWPVLVFLGASAFLAFALFMPKKRPSKK